jgi:hypothetical protein
MQNITTSARLKKAIALLEESQKISKQKLYDEFHDTYKKLKNVGKLSNAFKSVISLFGTNVLNDTAGLTAGYLIKKAVVGDSKSRFRKILGSVLQIGVVRCVSQNPKMIRKAGLFLMNFIPHSKHRKKRSGDK